MKKRKASARMFSLLLALIIMVGIPVPASAAGSKVNGYDKGSLEDHFHLGQSMDPNCLEVRPGDEIRIPLTADMFTFSDGKVAINNEATTFNELSKVRVRAEIRRGRAVLDYIQLDTDIFAGKPFITANGTTPSGKTAYISVMFAEDFVSVEDKDFDMTIYLRINGTSYREDLSIDLSGTMVTDVFELTAGTDYVNISDNMVVKAAEDIRGIELDLDNGVSVFANLKEGSKYCGTSKIVEGYSGEITESQLEMVGIDIQPDLYGDIVCVYKLSTVNLDGVRTKVRLDIGDNAPQAEYHVYGEDFTYLGTTSGELKYSGLYFLARQRLPQVELLGLGNYTKAPESRATEVEEVTEDVDFGGVEGSRAMVDDEGEPVMRFYDGTPDAVPEEEDAAIMRFYE